MVTGKVSKVFTLDFDGKPGRRTMKKLGLKPHRSTPSGGFHVDFVHPGWPVTTVNGKSKRKLGSLYSGMDIRGRRRVRLYSRYVQWGPLRAAS